MSERQEEWKGAMELMIMKGEGERAMLWRNDFH